MTFLVKYCVLINLYHMVWLNKDCFLFYWKFVCLLFLQPRRKRLAVESLTKTWSGRRNFSGWNWITEYTHNANVFHSQFSDKKWVKHSKEDTQLITSFLESERKISWWVYLEAKSKLVSKPPNSFRFLNALP